MKLRELLDRLGIEDDAKVYASLSAVHAAAQRFTEATKPMLVGIARLAEEAKPMLDEEAKPMLVGIARLAKEAKPMLVEATQALGQIPGYASATTDSERTAAVEALWLATWPRTLTRRLDVPAGPQLFLAGLRERDEREWLALAERHADDLLRVERAYLAFHYAQDLTHFFAMKLVESVIWAAESRAHSGQSLEWAACGAWTRFVISAPKFADRFKPADFAAAVNAWRGKKGNRPKDGAPRQWDAISTLTTQLGYDCDVDNLGRTWWKWVKATKWLARLAEEKQTWKVT